jgi:hypothetical protein
MKIHSHWINNEADNEYRREFFGRKSEQQAAARKAEANGWKVLNEGYYEVEPNAEGLAKFMNEHGCSSCQHDLVEYYVETEILGGDGL